MKPFTATATAAVISLRRDSPVPLFRQVEEELSAAIASGVLRPGIRLPSTRALAESLQVARNTIVLAFDDLLAQGLLEARVGAGTFVAEQPRGAPALADMRNGHASPRLSRRGHKIAGLAVTRVQQRGPVRAFRAGVPAIDSFALESWMQEASKAQRRASNGLLGYGDPAGFLPLRKAIAEYLGANRAVRCTAEQVVIVSGSQQALDLSARLLVDPWDRVWMEDPARTGATGAFAAADVRWVPIPLDDDGLVVDTAVRLEPRARLAYVSPSHQFPLGSTMSLQRRRRLVDWAVAADAWILEDDYDGEFHLDNAPLPSIQGIAPERVVYVGSFSRSIFPSLRLGYVVVPNGIVEAFQRTRALMDRQSPIWEQTTLARFIADGYFDRHLRRMRKIYRERRDALLELSETMLDGLLDVRRDSAGLHAVGFLPPGSDDSRAQQAAAAHGVDVTAVSPFSVQMPSPPALLLGFGAVNPAEMRGPVEALAAALATGSHLGSGPTTPR